MDSPRLKQAMEMLGFEDDDLDTKKRRDYFRETVEVKQAPSPKAVNSVDNVVKSMSTIDPIDVDERIVNMRFKHY